MKALIIVGAVMVSLAGFAHAADLPTTKAPAPEKAKPNCWASLWDWLNASASDCPFSAYGFTLYGTLDVNATYLHNGVNNNPSADKPSYGIQRNASESKWLAGYNGLSTSVIGLKMKEEVLPYDWSIIGVLEAGISPYSGMFNNGRARSPITTRDLLAIILGRTETPTRAAPGNGATPRPTWASATRFTGR
jgi:hypothetical protein